MQSNNYLIIGKIGKPHGLKGEFIIHFYLDRDEDPSFTEFYIKQGNDYVIFQGLTIKLAGNHYLGKIQGVDAREKAHEYCNLDLYINRNDLPETNEDEYYYTDLIGSICYYEGDVLGKLEDIHNFGSSDLFGIKTNTGKYIYIPYLKDLLQEINIDEGTITFKNLEGYI